MSHELFAICDKCKSRDGCPHCRFTGFRIVEAWRIIADVLRKSEHQTLTNLIEEKHGANASAE